MSTEPSVFIGLWRDYSEQGVNQLTLTLSSRWGNYLISATALVVSLAGSCLWTIIAYTFHQLQVRKEGRLDPIQSETQVLLRNSNTPASAIVDSLSIFVDRPNNTNSQGVFRRLFPIIALASLCMTLFTLAGTFVSGLVAQNESQVVVLAKPDVCGGWFFNMTSVENIATGPADAVQLGIISKDTMDARLYAKWFYGNETPLSVQNSRFPVRSLPSTAKSTPCPFKGEGRCLGKNGTATETATVWDTGLMDSHYELGVNAPVEERVQVRKVLTCSPVNVSDLTTQTTTNGTIRVSYEGLNVPDFFTLSNVNNTYGVAGYAGRCAFWMGAAKKIAWSAEAFNSDNVDLSICFVNQNSVCYEVPVYDPLFLATNKTARFGEDCYLADNVFNAVACFDQMQFCNPQNEKCTNLTHGGEALGQTQLLGLNLNQGIVVNKTLMLLGLTITSQLSVGSLGAAGLLARDETYSDTLSKPLPTNQWETEVQLWFQTGLAQLQAHLLRFLSRIDLTSPLTYGFYLIFTPLHQIPQPLRDAAEKNCHNQKFTTTGRFQNFRFFRLMLVMGVSLLVILTSLVLEPCVRILRRFYVSATGEARQNARNTDSKFWLVRVATDRIGAGPWTVSRQGSDVALPILHHTRPPAASSLRERADSPASTKLLREQRYDYTAPGYENMRN